MKAKYERECHRRELLQKKLLELEKDLQNKQCQSKLLGQLQTDVERLHLAFNALEVKSNNKNEIYLILFRFRRRKILNLMLNYLWLKILVLHLLVFHLNLINSDMVNILKICNQV